jgi:uncharacterized protein (TIGR03437 family)
LTVNGTGFVNGSVARWDGQDRVTTFVSATQLRAQILASDIIGIGQASVTVFNPAPGGGLSNVATFDITPPNSPVPVLNSISPTSVSAGVAAFALTANGSGFVSTSKVRWNGQDLVTAFISSTQLTAQVTADLVASGGTAQVTVFTPTPGGGTSAARTFTINQGNNPVPSITALSPPAVPAGAAGFTLMITGTNFVSGSQVRIGSNTRVTTVVSSTQLTATILASDITSVGDRAITVVNPAPGGGTSNAMTLKVAPAVTSVSAASFLGAQLAPESIVAGFGSNMATGVAIANSLPLPTTLLGTTVDVIDSATRTTRPSSLFFVAPAQINYQIPAGTADGTAWAIVRINGNIVGAGVMTIGKVAPGLISANANGQGVAAAVVLRIRNGVQTFEPVASFDSGQSRFVPIPIDMGPQGDIVYVLLYGTGIRNRSKAENIVVNIRGSSRPLDPAQYEDGFAAPGFVGLDQINLALSRALIGGGLINITVTVDGKVSNTIQLSIK